MKSPTCRTDAAPRTGDTVQNMWITFNQATQTTMETTKPTMSEATAEGSTEETTEETTEASTEAPRRLPVMLTVREVSDCLDISRRTIYKLVKRGELESVRVGGQHRIPARAVLPPAEVQRLEEQQQQHQRAVQELDKG